jgi:hypothetical protein
MSEFEIITITLSFIIGLGVAQLLTSFSAAMRARLEHPLHWMPFAWGVPILVFSVQYWFALLGLNQVLVAWGWLWYAQILALAIALFLAGAMLLPTRASTAKASLREDFIIHGRYSLLALVFYLLGWIAPNAKMDGGNVFSEANALNTVMAVLAIIAFKSKDERVWIITTTVFYIVFWYTVLAFYATPGAQPGPLA